MKILSKLSLASVSLLMVALPTVSVAALSPKGDSMSTAATATAKTEADTTTTDTPTANDPSDSTTKTGQSNAESKNANAEAKRAAAQAKQKEAKLRACENHQKVVTNIMTRISDRGQKQLDLFTKIADRTEAFYVAKGKNLSNYQALVDDVNAKKAAAQATVTTIATTTTNFNCDGATDKTKVSSFKDSLKAEISALKDYKTAVRNLIVGVKSVQSTTTDTKASTTTTTTTGGNQ